MDSLGALIARLRTSRGLSQQQLAAALRDVSGRPTFTREELSRWEHDRRTPTPYWLAHLAAALGVPLSALRTNETVNPAPDTADALRLALEWLLTEPPQLAETRAGRRIGIHLAEQIQQRVVRLRHLDDEISGLDLAPLVLREYAATRRLVDESSYTSHVGRTLLTSLGELGQITGWVLSDAAYHPQAQAHYLDGFAAARDAHDKAGAANLLSCLAYQWTNLGYPKDAELLASTALHAAAPDVTPTVRALLGERLAYSRAHLGQREATRRALDQVDADFAARSTHDNDPEWVYWLSRDEITVMAARCYTRLKDAVRAAPLLTDVLTRYSQNQIREQALYHAFLAEAHLEAGDRAQAADVLEVAAGYARTTASARADARIAHLQRRLTG